MGQFFDQVLGYFDVIWTSLSNSMNSALQAMVFLTSGADTIFRLLGYMPLIVSSCCVIVVIFSIIKFVLGR